MLMEAVLVDMVSRVVTPRATRAGAALGSIQKENLKMSVLLGDERRETHQDTMTNMQVGT